MNQEQEIRAKALEIAVQAMALLPSDVRTKFLNANGATVQKAVITAAKTFVEYIEGPKP